ncbi:MAG: cadherin-like domain-containing protein, partial [Chromatiales bacterium]|nr:cadherin-like domain-containing protein [Chromatiales bacterium]
FEKSTVTTELGEKSYVNQFPIAANDQVQAQRNGGAVLIDVLANDTDPDNDTMTISAVTQPVGGSVENFGDVLSFTPQQGFSGQTEFTYTMKDTQGAESQAIVTIEVINDGPIAGNDEAFTNQGVAITIDVLANDTDANGDTMELVSVTQPTNGSASIENGKIVYQPAADFVGTNTFNYTIKDAAGATSSAQVVVTVSDIANTPPVAVNDWHITPYMSRINVKVLANDYDPDGDKLTVVSIDNLPSPEIGTYEINDNGSITLTPTGWSGKTVLTIHYTISDGRGGTDTAELSILDP